MARASPALMRARIALAALLAASVLPFARAADPEVSRLLERAEFWSERSRDDLAREELAKLFRLAPDNAEALAMLARLQLRADQDRDAAATFERLRAARPSHPEVRRIAALLRVRGEDREKLRQARQLARAGRADEAVKAYRALFPEEFPDDELTLEYAQSLAATRAGRDAGARLIADLARKHPADPRFQVALATDLSTRKPVAPATLRMLRELTAVASVSRQAREAWRRALLALDDADEASLAPLREYLNASPGDTALQEKLDSVVKATAAVRKRREDPGYRARAEAAEALEAGRLDEARAKLDRAIELHPDDAETLGTLGLLRLRESRHAEALDLFRRARSLDPAQRARWESLERTARYWALLQQAASARSAGDFDAARALVREAVALDPAPAGAQEELARIEQAVRSARASELRERARALRDKGDDAQALALLEEAATLDPESPWILHDIARIHAARGDPSRGDAAFEAMRRRRPDDPDVRYAMALYLASIDRDADAIAALDTIPAARRSEGMKELRARILAQRERRASDEVRANQRREAAALLDASRAAQAEGDVDRAVELERRSLAMDPNDEPWRARRLGELTDQQLAWAGAGVDALHRSGTPGKSRFDVQEISAGYRAPWSRGGRTFFRVAFAHVSSGNLDTTSDYEVSRYGSLLTCEPACGNARADSSHDGASITAGSQMGPWRLDLGASGIGFPVVNVVGGALYDATLGPFSYSVDIARRPLVSSLLSYAGVRDPASGATWGGVVSNGVRVNVSRDSGGDYGAWALAGLYRLTGRNVKDNDKAEAMAGAYWRILNEENRQAMAGFTTMLWRFSENAGEYTFGHGGYYSPKTYASLSLPVSYGARMGELSLYARASVSISWSESRRAPFFPTSPALQSQAEALASVNGIDPFHPGGSNGRGYGRSFAAAVERRIAPRVFAGARIDIDRSTNYTPNRLLLYVRAAFGGVPSRPPANPPEPVVMPGFQY